MAQRQQTTTHSSSHSLSMSSKVRLGPKNGEYVRKTIEKTILTGTRESSENSSSSSNVQRTGAKLIDIYSPDTICAVVFLDDGKHVAGGGKEGKIRRWRIEDGKEVGWPMDAESPVCDIAVSRDGKWVVGGMESGWVAVWNAESHSKVTEFKAHNDRSGACSRRLAGWDGNCNGSA